MACLRSAAVVVTALACVVASTGTARAQICAVDLEALTDDPSARYTLYFGEVESTRRTSRGLALCLGQASAGETDAAALDAELVAFAGTERDGTCATTDYAMTCGAEGCDSIESIVWRKDNVALGIPEAGLRCRDARGLVGAAGGVIALGDASDTHTTTVLDTTDDAIMALEGTRASCTIGSSDYFTLYGQGSYYVGMGYLYTGSMYVCSGTYAGISRICSYSLSTMQQSGLIMIVGNDLDNEVTVPYQYSSPLNCNGGTYRVFWWDSRWARGMYLWGDEGDDTLIGSPNDDYIYGLEDDDVLVGAGGDDYLRGYGGTDVLYGDSEALADPPGDPGDDGDDTLLGMDDNDDLYGEGGTDDLYGGDEYDYLDGGAGTGDYCDAGAGYNWCPSYDCCEVPGCETSVSCGT